MKAYDRMGNELYRGTTVHLLGHSMTVAGTGDITGFTKDGHVVVNLGKCKRTVHPYDTLKDM